MTISNGWFIIVSRWLQTLYARGRWLTLYMLLLSQSKHLSPLRQSLLWITRSASSKLVRKTKRGTTDHTSRDSILHREVLDLLAALNIDLNRARVTDPLIEQFMFSKNRGDVVLHDVRIQALTSEADGLAVVPRTYSPDYVGESQESSEVDAVFKDSRTTNNVDSLNSASGSQKISPSYIVLKVPKTVPGDIVDVKLKRHFRYYAEADLIRVKLNERARSRDDKLVVCRYFDQCLGCQLQMLTYDQQLVHKQNVIKKAYKYFYPGLDTALMDDFGYVVGSPMQYSYRTKLTPHSSIPRNLLKAKGPFPLGFKNIQSDRPIVDVEQCPIAVNSVNKMLPSLRASFQKQINNKLAGRTSTKIPLTLLLRDSAVTPDLSERECLTKQNSIITETVDKKVFQFLSNDFFQNNRSILPTFLDFLRYQVSIAEGQFKYIIDSYCGSGFLGISLNEIVPSDGKVYGIEISESSVQYARHNAKLNGLTEDNALFTAGNSDDMFSHPDFKAAKVEGSQCVLIMNPSRKGSSKVFLKQVLKFKPKMIVYISCNVFSQARDLQHLEELLSADGPSYKVTNITGFDFYPQTKHVESVAILKLDDGV